MKQPSFGHVERFRWSIEFYSKWLLSLIFYYHYYYLWCVYIERDLKSIAEMYDRLQKDNK